MPSKNTPQDLNPPQHEARSKCAIANGLEVLGDRWTLLIIRDLMLTNRNEFGHLLHSGEGISTNILSERLERLQQYNIITKHPHPSHGKKFTYTLTDKGLELAPALIEFALWSKNTFESALIPEVIHDMMLNHRKKLLAKVQRREPLVILDL